MGPTSVPLKPKVFIYSSIRPSTSNPLASMYLLRAGSGASTSSLRRVLNSKIEYSGFWIRGCRYIIVHSG